MSAEILESFMIKTSIFTLNVTRKSTPDLFMCLNPIMPRICPYQIITSILHDSPNSLHNVQNKISLSEQHL